MDEMLRSMAADSPSLVGIIVVVIFFLRALAARDKTISEIAIMFAETTKESVAEMKDLREVIGANSEIIKRCHDKI
ncbi:hypothetical protein LCGC14_1207650 [marine sediment metagenome]|uniref:Uncharacterized protein n=1 Tax=marine sediment metagenome TaxID=412755 RepID=A0A0F9LJF1_9ZZZZ